MPCLRLDSTELEETSTVLQDASRVYFDAGQSAWGVCCCDVPAGDAWILDAAAGLRTELSSLSDEFSADARELATRAAYVTSETPLPVAAVQTTTIGGGSILARPGIDFTLVVPPVATGTATTTIGAESILVRPGIEYQLVPPAGGDSLFAATTPATVIATPGGGAVLGGGGGYLPNFPIGVGGGGGGGGGGLDVTSSWASRQAQMTSAANTFNLVGTNPGLTAVNTGGGVDIIGGGSSAPLNSASGTY